jgi:hypothetical protein
VLLKELLVLMLLLLLVGHLLFKVLLLKDTLFVLVWDTGHRLRLLLHGVARRCHRVWQLASGERSI